VQIDVHGESGVPNLFVAGEASGGLHGRNRLMGNSLLDLMVYGKRAGTATATLVDLAGERARGQATLVAAVANMGGLGCGPLLAGILAQLAPLPLRLSFWVDLGLLVPAFLAVLLMPEPVHPRPGQQLRVQALSVPLQTRAAFIPAALAGFADPEWVVGDLGCGTGQMSAALAPFVARVVAVDGSAAMLQAAPAAVAASTTAES